jgi:two-component system response regulator
MIEHAIILVADDSPDEAEMLTRALHEAGLPNPVQHVKDGYAAIQFLKEEKERSGSESASTWPLLMFLNLRMPRGTGFVALDWLRRQPDLRHLPTIVYTDSDSPSDIENSIRLGANSYWIKPSKFEDLVRMLRKLKDLLAQIISKVEPDLAAPAFG